MIKRSIPGFKDENGAYLPIKVMAPSPIPVKEELPDTDLSLDDIGKRIMLSLDRATKTLLANISTGDVSRETIGALKDAHSMFKDLKKEEKDILDNMSEDDLKKALSK